MANNISSSLKNRMNSGSSNQRNPGIPFSLDWLKGVRVNRSAVERRVSTIATRRSIKKEWQAAWLLKTVTLIDLTTLAGDDTASKVNRLCAKARSPVRQDILDAIDIDKEQIKVAAVCVYHSLLAPAIYALKETNIPVAAVSAGLPAGLSPLEARLREVELSVAGGASEIDIVINRGHVLTGKWEELYNEICHFLQKSLIPSAPYG